MDGLGVDWKRVDLYGKMGVSKIVREIEGMSTDFKSVGLRII